MKISPPLTITPRLLPGAKIGGSFLSIEFHHQSTKSSRYYYNYHIDTPEFEFSAHDISSPRYSLQEAFSTLLSFLSAAAESYQSTMHNRYSGNRDLFPENIMEWAYQNSDEISMLAYELENDNGLIN